jgi:hypothetical protein
LAGKKRVGEEEKVRFKDEGLKNGIRGPGVCEHDSTPKTDKEQ